MRIALIAPPFIRVPPNGYGGTELFCYDLAEGLSARHDVTLFATGDSRARCRVRALYERPVWPPSSADEANHAAWALAEAARGGYDVVHVNSALAVPFSRFVRVPFVCTIHSARDEHTSRIYAAHPAVTYVGISSRQLALEVPLRRAHVVHHGVAPERYPFGARDEGYLLHLGRFCEQKGTHLAIDVALEADLPLQLAGRTHELDREYAEAEVAPRVARARGRVALLGEAGPERKTALLRGARGLLCPLRWEEPFGLIAIEAMLCGTPVLGFPRGSFPEIVDEGVTGFLVPDGDVAAMARVARALEGFDRARCARRARERFSADRMVAAYERIYRDAALPSRRAA